jgi:hypothetical protein
MRIERKKDMEESLCMSTTGEYMTNILRDLWTGESEYTALMIIKDSGAPMEIGEKILTGCMHIEGDTRDKNGLSVVESEKIIEEYNGCSLLFIKQKIRVIEIRLNVLITEGVQKNEEAYLMKKKWDIKEFREKAKKLQITLFIMYEYIGGNFFDFTFCGYDKKDYFTEFELKFFNKWEIYCRKNLIPNYEFIFPVPDKCETWEELRDAWINPYGDVYSVCIGGHVEMSLKICYAGIVDVSKLEEFNINTHLFSSERFLELLGWCKISDRKVYWNSVNFNRSLTKKQKEFLISWKLDIGENEIEINGIKTSLQEFMEGRE